jgi:hypothetical protein
MPRTRQARRLATLRAPRYGSGKELRAAVLAWCREWIHEQNPACDVARLERYLTRWQRESAAIDEEAFEHWSAVLDAIQRAEKFLEAKPRASQHSTFAGRIEGFLGTLCQGNDGNFDKSIRERLKHSRRVSKKERWPLGSSPRARLVASFQNLPGTMTWWDNRQPSPRDLAVINLLAGLWPDAARKRQAEGIGGARPTVKAVVRAEENAVRATLPAKRRQGG